MSTVVKNLLVKFGGDTKGLDSASSRAKSALDGVAKAGKIAATAAAALAVGFGILAVKQSHLGDELGKTSDRIGITTETLAGYYHAADLAGVSTGTLNNAIKFMFKNAVEAASGNTELAAAFNALRINTETFINLAPQDQFELLSQRISEIENPAVRAAIAMKVFGRSGEDMLNLIKDGTGVLTEAKEEAKRFGLEISRIDAAQLEAANDAVAKIAAATGGAARQFAVGLTPAITATIENLLRGVDVAEEFRGIGQAIGDTWVAAMSAAGWAVDQYKIKIQELRTVTLETGRAIRSFLGQDVSEVDDMINFQKLKTDRLKENRALNDQGLGGDFNKSIMGDYFKQQDKQIKQASTNTGIDDKTKALLASLTTTGGEAEKAKKALKDHEDAAKKAQDAQIQYNNTVADSFIGMKDQMLAGGSAMDNFKKIALNAVNEIANNLIKLSFGGDKGSGGGGLFGSLASSIFSGIAGIKGFANGGSFTVGGDGATDSGLVAFKATRGEQVTVTKPNQSMSSGGGVSITQNITIGTSVSASVRQEVAKMLPDLKRSVISGVEDARLRGSTI